MSFQLSAILSIDFLQLKGQLLFACFSGISEIVKPFALGKKRTWGETRTNYVEKASTAVELVYLVPTVLLLLLLLTNFFPTFSLLLLLHQRFSTLLCVLLSTLPRVETSNSPPRTRVPGALFCFVFLPEFSFLSTFLGVNCPRRISCRPAAPSKHSSIDTSLRVDCFSV